MFRFHLLKLFVLDLWHLYYIPNSFIHIQLVRQVITRKTFFQINKKEQ